MPCLLLALVLAADPPDVAKALEDRMVRAIAAAEPGVAAVVVGHRKYKNEQAAERPGHLGKYQPEAADAVSLNLADPQAAADNSFGSGLVLSADGHILTAYHLVDGATKLFVRTAAGGSYADVHAADARSDLAVLKLIDPPDGLVPVRLAAVRTGRGPRGEPPTVRRGQWVIALGHPLAVGSADGAPSASWGILSNLRRRLATAAAGSDSRSRTLASFGTLLQTDARLTAGGSGGGLFNLDGEALGLTSSVAAVAGADTAGGYAVPFDAATRRMIDSLLAGREVEYGFLGVQMDVGVGRGEGVVLTKTTPGMPARQAGLGTGDRVVAIDGQPVTDADDLFLLVGAAQAGTPVRVTYVRGSRRQEATATLAKHKHNLPWLASRKRPAVFGLRPDWSSVIVVEQGGPPGGLPAGVVIAELEPGSPAEEKLKPLDAAGRWLVTAVDGRPVPTPAAFAAAAAGKESVRLTLHDPARPDRPVEVSLP